MKHTLKYVIKTRPNKDYFWQWSYSITISVRPSVCPSVLFSKLLTHKKTQRAFWVIFDNWHGDFKFLISNIFFQSDCPSDDDESIPNPTPPPSMHRLHPSRPDPVYNLDISDLLFVIIIISVFVIVFILFCLYNVLVSKV